MFIGVTGDTHNNLKNISKICDIFNEIKPSFIIHTGDITLPKSIKAFSKLKMPLIGVFGNNDEGEKKDLIVESKTYNFKLHEEPLFIEKENIKIAVVHHPELINEKMTKEMDFILHGHTHKFRSELINKALIFNPGECAGIMKGKNNIGLIDTKRKDSKIISF